jgi:tetratricopeptide (TPR) repeat protein
MRNISSWSFLCAIAIVLTACGGNTEAKADPETTHAIEGARRIRAMEDSIFNAKAGFDPRSAQALVDVYLAYAKTHPLDSLAPEFIFRAAGVKRSLKDPKASIALYDRIIRDYNGWRKLADAYYLRAFVIDSDLGQKGEAKKAYEEVIGRFPDHPFAQDAQRMIDYLGMSDEELLKRFEQMNDSAATTR